MSDATFENLQSLDGKPNSVANYPWSYDPTLIEDYYESMGYKPAYMRDFSDSNEEAECDYILRTLYGSLKRKWDFLYA